MNKYAWIFFGEGLPSLCKYISSLGLLTSTKGGPSEEYDICPKNSECVSNCLSIIELFTFYRHIIFTTEMFNDSQIDWNPQTCFHDSYNDWNSIYVGVVKHLCAKKLYICNTCVKYRRLLKAVVIIWNLKISFILHYSRIFKILVLNEYSIQHCFDLHQWILIWSVCWTWRWTWRQKSFVLQTHSVNICRHIPLCIKYVTAWDITFSWRLRISNATVRNFPNYQSKLDR